MFDQHSNSNDRKFTDNYLAETSTEFSYERNREQIALLKEALEYITVSDQTIAEIREESGNTLTRGDVVALILAKEFKDYQGLEDPNEMEDSEKGVGGVLKKASKKTIETSFYDFEKSETVFFLK